MLKSDPSGCSSLLQAYHDPMLKLSIMSEEELTHIFGNLDDYIPLHEDLLSLLSKATGSDGTVGQIGQIVISWVSVLYCSLEMPFFLG